MSSMIIANGDLTRFFEVRTAGTLGIVTLIVWIARPLLALVGRSRGRSPTLQS